MTDLHRSIVRWSLLALLVLADLLLIPWLLWGTDTPYSPTALLRRWRAGDQQASAVIGEWILIHVGPISLVLWWKSRAPAHPREPMEASHYGSHGTARLAHARELRPYLRRSGPGLIFGQFRGQSVMLPADPKLPFNRNVTVLGSSGTRKTRSFVQPNLLQETLHQHSSIICMDPKGENYARSAVVLRNAGYEVRLLNFLEMEHSDRWNPLQAVHSTTDAADLAVNLVANTLNPNRPRSGDPFWDQAEQSFITALVLYVKRHRPPAEQHMASVLELGAELHPNNLDHIFLALPKDSPARRFYRTFLRAEEKVRSGVVAGIGSRLQLWNVPEVVALTSASDISIENLGRKRTALFLVIPDSKTTYTPVLALFWQQAFQVLYNLADRNGGTLPVRVRCVMDEIANCGYIPDYAQKKSTMRSRGISTEEIWQSLGQLKSRYTSTWGELLANSDHLLFLGANDLETAQYISSRTGVTTISVLGTGATEGTTGGSTSASTTFVGRPVLTADECLRLNTEHALLFPKGQYPALIGKTDFTDHPAARLIVLSDHRTYQVHQREPTTVTDVSALLASVLPKVDEAGAANQPEADPSQFIDQDSDQREEETG